MTIAHSVIVTLMAWVISQPAGWTQMCSRSPWEMAADTAEAAVGLSPQGVEMFWTRTAV